MWIGEQKIKAEIDLTDGNVNVQFKDNTEIVINNELLKLIKHKEKRVGFVTDAVRNILATKFLSEMADYGLDMSMVNTIAIGMETLAHNLRNEAISRKFGVSGIDVLLLTQLLEESNEEVEKV